MNGTLQFGKFKFVADNPYNQITKLRGNCLMQLALFCSSEKSLTFFFNPPPKKRHPFVQVIQQLNTNVIFIKRSRDMYKNCKHGVRFAEGGVHLLSPWGAFPMREGCNRLEEVQSIGRRGAILQGWGAFHVRWGAKFCKWGAFFRGEGCILSKYEFFAIS